MEDMVKNPKHYARGKIQPIDLINQLNLNFNLGNIIKYVCRADYKGTPMQDLEKAKEYLEYEIKRRKKLQGVNNNGTENY